MNHDSDELMLLQDVLDEVVNGRTKGHHCPFCGASPLKVEVDEGKVRLDCSDCGKFFEGMLA